MTHYYERLQFYGHRTTNSFTNYSRPIHFIVILTYGFFLLIILVVYSKIKKQDLMKTLMNEISKINDNFFSLKVK